MSPDELREATAVMLAAADGAEIEYQLRGSNPSTWYLAGTPAWDWCRVVYRVRQPQPVPVECWCIQLVHDAGHEMGAWTYDTKQEADKVMAIAFPPGTVFHGCRIRLFKMREVCE